MLTQDHRRVAQLFEKFESAKDAKQKKSLFETIRSELELHARLEEDLFYPEAEDRPELKDPVEEAEGEHAKMKQMLREAQGLDPESGEFDATVAGLKGAVEHHVEEEEGQIFPVVQRTFSEEHMQELAEKLQARRAELQRGNGAKGEGKSLVGRLMGR
jgi:hemerythrin-like domain-containing protein